MSMNREPVADIFLGFLGCVLIAVGFFWWRLSVDEFWHASAERQTTGPLLLGVGGAFLILLAVIIYAGRGRPSTR